MATGPTASDVEAELRAARALGRAEATEFDDRLRRRDLADRERLRAQSVADNGSGRPSGRAFGAHDATLRRLRREEEELSSYHQAILASRAWRAAELLRGLVGRSWRTSAASPDVVDPAGGVGGGTVGPIVGGPAELARLEARVQELAAFVAAVGRSRSWRTIQAMRRLVGREW